MGLVECQTAGRGAPCHRCHKIWQTKIQPEETRILTKTVVNDANIKHILNHRIVKKNSKKTLEDEVGGDLLPIGVTACVTRHASFDDGDDSDNIFFISWHIIENHKDTPNFFLLNFIVAAFCHIILH